MIAGKGSDKKDDGPANTPEVVLEERVLIEEQIAPDPDNTTEETANAPPVGDPSGSGQSGMEEMNTDSSGEEMPGTDPAVEELLAGIGSGSYHHSDEEMVRWIAALIRHYAIAGKTDSLAEKLGYRYNPGFIANPDFDDGLNGWTADAGSGDPIKALRIPGYGGGVQARKGAKCEGDRMALFVRDTKRANRLSQKVKGNVTLLIIGVMIGYLANAIIGVLKFFSAEEDVKAFVVWGLGSFARVSGDQMLLFVTLMAILLPLSMLLVKTMNLLLLGDAYARNLGLNIQRSRLLVIVCSGVLVAIVTAYCGPIMFIGLAVPHLARALYRTSDHRILMPGTMLAGGGLALVCNLLARLPGFEGALPVNSVTALVGAPVIAMVLFRRRKDEVGE